MAEKPLPSPAIAETYLDFWTGGINSLLHPSNPGERQYVHGENIITRGGVPQTRPGFDLRLGIAGETAQGCKLFTPTNSLPVLVMAVDGLIYVSPYPFTGFSLLGGITFSSSVERIVFQAAVKSVERLPDGTLRNIKPIRVLIMQDGVSRAAFWDGKTARHLNPDLPFRETPTGTWMAWSGTRLWVARGNHLFASDLADPLSNWEGSYIAERDRFELPGDCTGLIDTPDKSALLAFTLEDTTAFKSSIRDRKLWLTTPDFQATLIPGVGCVSGRTPVNSGGKTSWLSKNGWVDLNSAMFQQRDSDVSPSDMEMMRHKTNISHTSDRACAVAFEKLILLSVPSGDIYNAQTWVLDHGVIKTLNEGTPNAWSSIWTGLRPVEWTKGSVLGQDRIFCLTYDATAFNGNRIHLWEAMTPDRQDRGNRVSSQFQTSLRTIDGSLHRFKYAEVELAEVMGNVSLTIYLTGTKGGFTEIYSGHFQAEEGSVENSAVEYDLDHIFENYIPQSRRFSTKEWSPQSSDGALQAESNLPANIDTAFGLLFEWRGRMGVKSIKMFTQAVPTMKGGTGEGDESSDTNILTEAGETK